MILDEVYNKILIPSEKIKWFRRKLNASHDDIAGKLIDKNLIDEIEKGISCLTKKDAHILAANINKIAKEKGIELVNLTGDYLIEDIRTQANRCIDNYNIEISQYMECGQDDKIKELISEVEIFVNKYNDKIEFEKLYSYYEKCIKYLYRNYQYGLCETYIYKTRNLALKNNKNHENIVIVGWLVLVFYKQNRYNDAIMYSEYILKEIESHEIDDSKLIKSVYFTTALSYKGLKEYSKCILWINKLESHSIIEESKKLDMKIVVANCCYEERLYTDAESIYLDVLNYAIENDDEKRKELCAKNLAKLYLDIKIYDEAKDFIEIALDINSNDERYRCSTLQYALLIYIELNEFDLVNKYFKESLEKAINIKDEPLQLEIIKVVYNYYTKYKYIEEIINFIEYIKDIAAKGIFNQDKAVNICYRASDYLKTNSNDKKNWEYVFNIGAEILQY